MSYLIKPQNWNYSPTSQAKDNSVNSQRYYMYILAIHIPKLAPLFNIIIDKIESNADKNEFKGWKSIAHEWANFINACCTAPSWDNADTMPYAQERDNWISQMTLQDFAIHHRALMISSVMMDGANFEEALNDWEWMWQEHPQDNKIMDGGYVFQQPNNLRHRGKSIDIKIDDNLFRGCETTVAEFKAVPILMTSLSNLDN